MVIELLFFFFILRKLVRIILVEQNIGPHIAIWCHRKNMFQPVVRGYEKGTLGEVEARGLVFGNLRIDGFRMLSGYVKTMNHSRVGAVVKMETEL